MPVIKIILLTLVAVALLVGFAAIWTIDSPKVEVSGKLGMTGGLIGVIAVAIGVADYNNFFKGDR